MCAMLVVMPLPCFGFQRLRVLVIKANARRNLSHVIALLLFLSICSEAGGQTPGEEETLYVTLHLPYGISVEIPRSWRLMVGETKEALETAVSGDIDLSHMHVPDSNVLLRANATPSDRPAWVSVAFLPKAVLTPAQAVKLSSGDLQDYDRNLRQRVESFLQSQKMELLEWHETRKDLLNEHLTLVSEYRRRGKNNLLVWEQINTIPLSAGMM